jgi:hypothetical protein
VDGHLAGDVIDEKFGLAVLRLWFAGVAHDFAPFGPPRNATVRSEC